MNTIFVDRESAYPNRYRVIPESGSEYYVVLERADEPVTPGTPLNAETFNTMLSEIDGAKAPSGYGLGTVAINPGTNGFNTTIGNAFIETGTGAAYDNSSWVGINVMFGNGFVHGYQEAVDVYLHYNVKTRRFKQNGVWGEWEYENPPMMLGVEYRTTQRWNDKPVYRKAITFRSSGTISGDFTVPNGISNMDVLVGCFATVNRTDILPYINGDYVTRVKSVTSGNISLANNNPYFNQDYTWYFELAYTKTV